MADKISKEHRSWTMSRVRSINTKPELIIRSKLHKNGFRFRLNGAVSKSYYKKGVLPGKPDIVLPLYKTVIFVNGCFWHQHNGCRKATIPANNQLFWRKKLFRTKVRDKENIKDLHKLGWNVITIWECEINSSLDDIMGNILSQLKQRIELRRNQS